MDQEHNYFVKCLWVWEEVSCLSLIFGRELTIIETSEISVNSREKLNVYDKVSYELKKKGATSQKISYEVNNAQNLTKFTTHYLDPSQIKVWPFLRPTPAPILAKTSCMY